MGENMTDMEQRYIELNKSIDEQTTERQKDELRQKLIEEVEELQGLVRSKTEQVQLIDDEFNSRFLDNRKELQSITETFKALYDGENKTMKLDLLTLKLPS